MNSTEQAWFDTIYGEWSRAELRRITRLMGHRVETVVDIGACVGAATQHYSRILVPKKIVAFEPDLDNWKMMCELVGPDPSIEINNWGIYYGAREVGVVGWKDGNMGGYHVDASLDGVEHNGELIVGKRFHVRTLEESIDFIPDLIKIDVEGSEYNIIENSTIVKEAKFLFIEWHHRSQKQIEEFVNTHLRNYVAIGVDSRGSVLFERSK
jgi:FkbM family methyltransferase